MMLRKMVFRRRFRTKYRVQRKNVWRLKVNLGEFDSVFNLFGKIKTGFQFSNLLKNRTAESCPAFRKERITGQSSTVGI